VRTDSTASGLPAETLKDDERRAATRTRTRADPAFMMEKRDRGMKKRVEVGL
jgi:hypothetical protein